MHNNLFIQRRFQVKRDRVKGEVHFIGSIYVAYYFYVKGELFVSKYALSLRMTKTESEVKAMINH